MSVDSLALVRTTSDRRPTYGQPVLNMHWTGVPSSFLTEEDALRRHGTISKRNMNPKNISSYMKGKDEAGKQREPSPMTRRQKKGCRPPAGGRMDLMTN